MSVGETTHDSQQCLVGVRGFSVKGMSEVSFAAHTQGPKPSKRMKTNKKDTTLGISKQLKN